MKKLLDFIFFYKKKICKIDCTFKATYILSFCMFEAISVPLVCCLFILFRLYFLFVKILFSDQLLSPSHDRI